MTRQRTTGRNMVQYSGTYGGKEMREYLGFNELEGQVIKSISTDGDTIKIITESGNHYAMGHEQD